MRRLALTLVFGLALTLGVVAPATAAQATDTQATDTRAADAQAADTRATDAQAADPAVTTTTVTVRADGRTFTARLVQPTEGAAGQYPVIAFGHGFVQSSARYASTLRDLAARGYIVIAPDSETGLLPSHSRFADDLWRALVWVRQTQPHASATLDGVAGHSMGGGAALLAASRHPDIDAVAVEAAAETRPSATAAARGIAAPALFVVGADDEVVKPSTTRAIFDAKPSPAVYAEVTGGYHCGFVDSSSFFGLGCDRGEISRSAQLALVQPLLGGWFDRVLRGVPGPVIPAGISVTTK